MSTAIASPVRQVPRTWTERFSLLWDHRSLLAKTAGVAFVVSLGISVILPKQYKSSASIMPPSSAGASTAMLAALTGHALGGLGGLGSLAGGLLGMGSSSALFIDLLHSGTVAGNIIDRFDLQHVYHKRYRIDTAKELSHRTTIVDDKKSGVITITVEDTDPRRARDIAQAYLDELNLLLNRTSTSSAHQERIFVERRLQQAKHDLEAAQASLSEFSSTHATVDLKEQARAMVSSAATLQAQILLEESNISSLRQVYGDGNVRLRTAQARVASLNAELAKMGGTSNPLPQEGTAEANEQESQLYPSLRQLPRLAVPFGNRLRDVEVQAKLFELLTEQFEMARISEAKDIPVLSVIDAPGIAEKKSFPPRALLTLALTAFAVLALCVFLLLRERWYTVPQNDPTRLLLYRVARTLAPRTWEPR
jgi:capsule polysaccharide export protein KpsE/RkpR